MIDLTKIFDAYPINGTTFIGLDTVTEPTLKGGRANPFKGRVKKVMTGASICLFQNKKTNGYKNMLCRRLIEEGKDPESFQLGARIWGERIEGTPVILHNGENYLECIFLKGGRVIYLVDGVETSPEAIQGLELDREESAQGGLSEAAKVIVRTFKAKSITKLRIGGEEIVGVL